MATVKINSVLGAMFSHMDSKLKTEKDTFRDQILDSELFKIAGQAVQDARLETNTVQKVGRPA